jgi:recombination protein RecA
MSSAVVSTSAASGRPFVFDDETVPEVSSPAGHHRGGQAEAQESPIARILQSAIKNQQSKIPPARVTPASQLDIRPAPEMVSCGIPPLDALTGGLPRGCLTEICGPASSGRTTLLLAALAAATRRGEFCVVVDASDALDPHSAAAAGVELDRLLWVRCGEYPPNPRTRQKGCPISRESFTGKAGAREACPELAERVGISSQATFDFDRTGLKKNGSKENELKQNASRQSEHRLEQVLRATDLLLESGGFGLIALDLGDLPPQAARRIPLTTWFRFRRAVEPTPTILLAIEPYPIAGSCSSLLLQLAPPNSQEETKTRMLDHPESSRVAAAGESPARQCRVGVENKAESHRDRPALGDMHVTYPTHAHLLTGIDITAELIRSRIERKPARSITFATKTAWAG